MPSITIDQRAFELGQRELHDLRAFLGYAQGECELALKHGHDPMVALERIQNYATKTLEKRAKRMGHA